MLRDLAAAALAITAMLSAAHAQDPDKLTSGPGSTLTTQKCQICHELGHVTRSRLSRGEWADNLKNMRERGAPLSDAEIDVIVGYLAAYYGREPAPAPAPDTLTARSDDPIAKLLADNGCTACHDVTKKLIGPAFREVAQKYAGDSGAAARLAAKMRAGGDGVWGSVPMPPNAGLSEADAKRLAAWVLGQK
ncbi:MAG TPA: c-type cytochrome [Burkholderiales bacterium]|nr:c-type cytochrome [Burkholderiales bacterium]